MDLSGITASLVNNGFSREQEREADWLGIDCMVRARYNPAGAVRLREVQKAYDLADEGDKLFKEKRYGEALAKYEAIGDLENAKKYAGMAK